MKKFILYLASAALLAPITACDDDDEPNIKKEWVEEDVATRTPSNFVKGCDPSWVTAMEDANWRFRDTEGNEGDCLQILQGVGFNACRLRVWVNPSEGYCNTADMVRKAVRAFDLGYTIMIDFHYSDSWADPAQQRKPSVWDDCATIDEMADKLYAYTKKVLTAVRANGVDVAWVQIGNETCGGMLKTNSDGSATDVNGQLGPNYVKLHSAGCKAAKEVYPNCKTIVHFENGQNADRLNWSLNTLKDNGIEFDILGVSLYPDFSDADWYANYVDATINNLNNIHDSFGCDVMVCETGCDIYNSNAQKALSDIVSRCKAEVPSCRGVFYWEPECYNPGTGGWNGYGLGGFNSNGAPSEALIAAFGK